MILNSISIHTNPQPNGLEIKHVNNIMEDGKFRAEFQEEFVLP